MYRKLFFILSILLLAVSQPIEAQRKSPAKNADIAFERGQYNAAIERYKKALKKMESIQNKIRDNEKIYNYLLSEEKFNLMMDNINKIIAQTVKEDYK